MQVVPRKHVSIFYIKKALEFLENVEINNVASLLVAEIDMTFSRISNRPNRNKYLII